MDYRLLHPWNFQARVLEWVVISFWIWPGIKLRSPTLQADALPSEPPGKPFWEESYDKPRQCIKKQRHHFADKGPYSQIYGFSSSYLWTWELDHKECWTVKNWCFQTVVPAPKTLENPLDSKEIKPVNPKGIQPWIFIGKTNTEAESPILWPHDVKNQLIGEDSDAGKNWGQEDRGNKGWDSCMASPTLRTWVGTNSRRLWRAGKRGMMRFMGLQRVGRDLATEQQGL